MFLAFIVGYLGFIYDCDVWVPGSKIEIVSSLLEILPHSETYLILTVSRNLYVWGAKKFYLQIKFY